DLANSREIRTRVAYAYDLKVFFNFLTEECSKFKNKNIKDLDLNDLKEVRATDINEFLSYTEYYINNEGEEKSNSENGKSRKLAAVRGLFKYFYRMEKIPSNPAELVNKPKIHEKEIIRLEPNETAELLDVIEKGEKLTSGEKRYYNKNAKRDLAIVTLLLGTGIRVSECVGIDIDDVDFELNGVKITRKGGNEMVVYFGEEVERAIKEYLKEREEVEPEKGSENALFLSIQNKRIGVRAVEKLVKKYAQKVTTLKKISPHKLRSTYGTALYNETGDIYLVADVLGHKDVNTTKRHYAQMQDDNRRRAAKAVKLRD
ncbi:MAG: tyrosine-type recombinase/integrase, partial [Clostridia bacterium]|nr:tyrosine-type recombinase/integrase [Clostridia bacterium]